MYSDHLPLLSAIVIGAIYGMITLLVNSKLDDLTLALQ